jgi:non-canonical poly(A) RNA polymerase PAPD5/7
LARLHKEVLDFYDYCRPRMFEMTVRQALVDKLRRMLYANPPAPVFKQCDVKAFGSFMSGLYLPIADMDLVVCSHQVLNGGPEDQRLKAKRTLWKFRDFLQNYGLCKGLPTVIVHAKVPLVKYIDKATGLNVDVSFENMSGINAIPTFLDWKAKYPVMPILVMVIKQFLVMRGYSEPVHGGIGSFTVICLVVSMLQMSPLVQADADMTGLNLGQLLLEFLDLYGNNFNYKDVAIRLNPPGYVRKVCKSIVLAASALFLQVS